MFDPIMSNGSIFILSLACAVSWSQHDWAAMSCSFAEIYCYCRCTSCLSTAAVLIHLQGLFVHRIFQVHRPARFCDCKLRCIVWNTYNESEKVYDHELCGYALPSTGRWPRPLGKITESNMTFENFTWLAANLLRVVKSLILHRRVWMTWGHVS